MSQLAERILNEALQLPEAERADVATKLFDSLDGAIEGYEDAEWEQELRRRIEQSDKGVVKSIPWSEATKMIFEDGNDDETA